MGVGFRIHGIGQFDKSHGIGPCAWPHFDLLTVLAGRVWIELAGDCVELTRGQAILIYPQTPFAGGSDAKSTAAAMHFEVSGDVDRAHPVQRLVGRREGYEILAAREPQAALGDVRRAVAMANRPAKASPIEREALLTLILSQLAARDASRQTASESSIDFGRVTQWISGHLHQQITLDELAAVAGCSTSHFRAAFTQQFGQSPGVFVRNARHLEAARLLRETRLPIKQIALKLGYDDLAHFYRFFQRIAKLTPKAYRDKHQLKG